MKIIGKNPTIQSSTFFGLSLDNVDALVKPSSTVANTYNANNKTIECTTVDCTTVQCNTVNCTTVQCNTVNCTTINCTTIQCNTVNCTYVQCNYKAECCDCDCRCYNNDCKDDEN